MYKQSETKVWKATQKLVSSYDQSEQGTIILESARRDNQTLNACSLDDFKDMLKDSSLSQGFRGTSFIGVSRNGKRNWQIISMFNGTKFYIGTVDNMLKAAILYDLFSVQTKGLNAKVNFNYTVREI